MFHKAVHIKTRENPHKHHATQFPWGAGACLWVLKRIRIRLHKLGDGGHGPWGRQLDMAEQTDTRGWAFGQEASRGCGIASQPHFTEREHVARGEPESRFNKVCLIGLLSGDRVGGAYTHLCGG